MIHTLQPQKQFTDMKHLYAILLIALCMIASTADVQAQRRNDRLNDEQATLLFNAKMKMMQEKLALTDKQTEQLIPIYKNYVTELDAIFKSKKFRRRHKPANADEACEIMTERLDVNARVIELQKKYIREFAKILNADQVMNIYRVESQIQREIRREKRRRSEARQPQACIHMCPPPSSTASRTA